MARDEARDSTAARRRRTGPSTGQRAPRQGPKNGRRSGFSTTRDLLSFLAGLAIIGHEVFFTATVEPAAVAIGVALTGLPVALGADERRRK